ncbi:MAG: polyprenyl synthetase family protein [Pyrinomonadaceae bacterium]|nr:polyprenyl synthetase family protein [Pyrinomonadaceae bacterium]
MVDLSKFIVESRDLVDSVLDRLVPSADIEPVRLHEAIRWSLFAGGKRFRPALLFAAGIAFGAEEEKLVRTAAAIELIHTFSLIHDDLPAMDDDDLRRGRLTCHKKYGEATAILAGDALQTLAFKAIADDQGLSFEVRTRLISMIAEASGSPVGMVAGQQMDLDAEGRDVDFDHLQRIHSWKTGALIAASAVSGGLIGGAVDEDVATLKRFAGKLGLLFQITDDIIDITQTTETLGKTAGKDENAQKATYPGHFGIERTRELASEAANDAKLELGRLAVNTTLLSEIVDHTLNRTF